MTNEERQEIYDKLFERFNTTGHFSGNMGIRVTRVEEDYAEAELELTDKHMNTLGIVHGGVLTTLADVVVAVAAASRGRSSVTLNNTMHFLTSTESKKLKAIAHKVKSGKTISIFAAELTDEENKLIATGTFTFFAKYGVR